MLFGEYAHNIDIKGRMIFPAKLREELGETFVVVKGFESRCLYVYSLAEWQRVEAAIKEMPRAKASPIQRFLFSTAAVVTPDKQGRIVLPSNLREFAELTKDVMVIGASVRVEIWDKELWGEATEKFTPEFVLAAMEELAF